MRFPPGHGGFGLFGSVFTDILAGLVFIILFIVVVGLLFVLVRFLLVATKAAELYIARNGGAEPVAPTTTTPVSTSTPRTRTTKPPTT